MPNFSCGLLRLTRAALAGTALFAALVAPASAQKKNLNVMVDWIIQGTHAPFLVAEQKGYYKQNGLTVTVDPGKGATNVAVSVAGGAYDFGWIDLPTLIKFNAQNPNAALIASYISFDQTPLAVITARSKNIKTVKDLNGKKILGGPGTAVYDTISILLKAAKAEDVKINWLPVQPSLFGPMMMRGEADGIGGFTNSNVPALLEVGFKMEDISVLKYSDFGADLYGLALVSTRKFADANPESVRAMVASLNKGTIDTIKDPEGALKYLTSRDPLMKASLEKTRLDIALTMVHTDWVKKNGLSVVQPERMKRMIDSVVAAYALPISPKPEDVYTDKFLPPVAERMVK